MVRTTKRWTEEDLRALRGGKQPEKTKKWGRYGNVQKIEEDGHRFDSKREYLRYVELKYLQMAGEIRELEVHPSYDIIIGGVPIMVSSNQHNKWDRQLRYEADFKYYKCIPYGMRGARVIEDVKMASGHRTGIYKLKRALMHAMGHEITEYT